jgi:hypothetical protein
MFNRILIYLHEMYPPIHFISTYIFTFIIAAALGTHLESFDFMYDIALHLGAFSVCLMSLMVRIMDDLKTTKMI